MDTAQWPQEIVVKPMEEIVPNTNTYSKPSLEKRAKPQKDQAVNCPRCNSTNTKFCYYNNYSLTQPRYFCKTCRRYWTEGGTLRNIPVGGGSRKNKRPSSSSSSSSSSKKLNTDLVPQHPTTSQNPKFNHEGQDLNLGFSSTNDFKTFSQLIQAPNSSSALELLSGISSRGGLSSFMPMAPIMDPNAVFSSGFSLPEFKPSLTFSLDGLGNSGYGSLQETSGSGRVLFPFEDLKQVPNTTTEAERNREQGDSTGYWSGMLGGGSW